MASKPAARQIPELVSAQELARLLDCSVQTIHGYGKAGILVSSGRKYEKDASFRGIYQKLSKTASGRGGNVSSDARKRLYEAQADLVEAKVATIKRDLLPADEVESHWSSMLRAVRAGVLAITSRCAIRDPGLSRASIENIDAESRAVLTELSEHDFDPGSPPSNDAEAGSAAEAEAEPVD